MSSESVRAKVGVNNVEEEMRSKRWLMWYGHVMRKDEDDQVRSCLSIEAEGTRPRG